MPSRASFPALQLFALCLLFLLCLCAPCSGGSANDAAVERLLAALAARGVSPPADLPRELGAHAACARHGRACPDAYVTFLEERLAAAGGPAPEAPQPEAPQPGAGEREKEAKATPKRTAKADTEADVEADAESQLANLRHLRNVLQDQLEGHKSHASMAHCSEVRWLRFGLRVALDVHNGIVMPCWSFAIGRLLPCVVTLALIVWIFFGDRIPREHLRCLLATDPTFLLNERRAKDKRSTSVAELVIERERFNMSGSGTNGDPHPASFATTYELEEEAYRHNRWSLTRFALLEVYSKARPTIVVLKLRLVLSLAVFLMLCWTLISLPLRATDIQGGQHNLFQDLIVLVFPSWVGASALLYVGWSWIGTMVAYAGWEVIAAFDALMHSEDRAAAMHEQVLQKWNE